MRDLPPRSRPERRVAPVLRWVERFGGVESAAHQPRGSATVKGTRPMSWADWRTDLGTCGRQPGQLGVTLRSARIAAE